MDAVGREAVAAQASSEVAAPAREPTIYQVVLQNHVGPIWPYWTFAAIGGAIFAILGHPLVALGMTLVCGLSDFLLQRTFSRWLARSEGVDSETGLSRLSHLAMWRTGLALAAPTATAVVTRDVIDLVYVMVGGTIFLLLAVSPWAPAKPCPARPRPNWSAAPGATSSTPATARWSPPCWTACRKAAGPGR